MRYMLPHPTIGQCHKLEQFTVVSWLQAGFDSRQEYNHLVSCVCVYAAVSNPAITGGKPFCLLTKNYGVFAGGSGIFQRLLKRIRYAKEGIVVPSRLDLQRPLQIMRHLKVHRTKPKSE